MEERKDTEQPESSVGNAVHPSPSELRRDTRRRLLKAGIMSVPVIMTVYSRPLFAQTNGSVDALAYGGYDETEPASIVEKSQVDSDPYERSWDSSGRFKTKTSEKYESPFVNNNPLFK